MTSSSLQTWGHFAMPQPTVWSSELGETVTLVETVEPAFTDTEDDPQDTFTVPKL